MIYYFLGLLRATAVNSETTVTRNLRAAKTSNDSSTRCFPVLTAAAEPRKSAGESVDRSVQFFDAQQTAAQIEDGRGQSDSRNNLNQLERDALQG